MTQTRWCRRPWVAATASVVAILLVGSGCGGTSSAVAPSHEGTSGASSAGTTDMANGGMGSPGGQAMAMRALDESDWQGMKISVALMESQRFTLFAGERRRLVRPQPGENAHLMVVLADAQTGERIPYASVWATVRDARGGVVFDERLWPMISRSMGTHYGANVALPAQGTYGVELLVGPPEAARHPEYTDVWLRPHPVELEFDWDGKL